MMDIDLFLVLVYLGLDLVGVLAVIFAIEIESILDMLIYAYHFWAPVIVIPLAAAFFGIKARARVFMAGCIAGLIGMILWNYLLRTPGGVDGLIIGVLSNTVVFAVAKRWDR
jgi:SSS family solute:Na+ symporter